MLDFLLIFFGSIIQVANTDNRGMSMVTIKHFLVSTRVN